MHNLDNLDDIKIAAELRTVISRLMKVLRRETSNEEGLSLTERSTLFLIYQSTIILPSELAAIEKVTNQSMSQIINKLLELGYINKTSSTQDKRKILITLTSAGKEIVERIKKEREEWLAKTINVKISSEEKVLLAKSIDVLKKLVEN
jgi:DNA-binding MarR family transcriptional regulator